MKGWNKKSILAGVLLLLLSCGGAAIVLVREMRGLPVLATLLAADPRWLLLGFAAMLLFHLGEALNIRLGLRLAGYSPTMRQVVGYAVAGFFFSSITPSASGGQPMQLFLMKRDGIRLAGGTFSLLTELIGFQIASVLWGLVGLLYCLCCHVLPWRSPYLWLFAVGFCLNITTLCLLAAILFSGRFANLTARFFGWFGERVLRRPPLAESARRAVADYHETSEKLRAHPTALTQLIGVSVLRLTAYHLIPYLCARALGLRFPGLLTALGLQGVLFVSVSSLPLPGAAGITEGGFAVLFGNLLPAVSAGSLLILSRFFGFLLPLTVCGLLLCLLRLNIRRRAAGLR